MSEEQVAKMRVCVIGAGPCGTAVLRAFFSAKEKGAAIPEIVCYEKQSDIGGLWNYSWRTGVDEFGEPEHCSMYRYLWSNGPKECLEFADYTFMHHFGRSIGSFPPREVLADYIKGRIEVSGVKECVKLNHVVQNVTHSKESDMFKVVVCDLKNDIVSNEVFDYAFVCTGHFSVPNAPHFPGFETFEGRLLHSHDFRDAEEMRNRDILVIGASYSAEDIASQCYKYGVKSVTISYRNNAGIANFKWPGNITVKPLLSHVEPRSKRCCFADGSTKDVDAIILCTGYKHHFPFLDDPIKLKCTNRMWPLDLYKGIFFENNPKVMYLGMQDQYYTFNYFDLQAWYARDVVLGRVKLPDAAERIADDESWRDLEMKLESPADDIVFQGNYVKMLLDATDYPKFDVDGVNEAFFVWEHHKEEDIMTYRDKSHVSLVDGTVAAIHHTPWVEALDDSMKCYMMEGK